MSGTYGLLGFGDERKTLRDILDPISRMLYDMPPMATPDTVAGRQDRGTQLTMPGMEVEPAVRPFGSPHAPVMTTPSEERRLADMAMMLGGMAGAIRAPIYRGAAAGAHNAPGGFWSRSPEMAEGHAARAGGTVAQAKGVEGATFGMGHPLTLRQASKIADSISKTHGKEWADDFARFLPLNKPVADAGALRALARQGDADIGDAAPHLLFWFRRAMGMNGANDPLRRAGFTAVDYGRDLQVLDPKAIVR